MVHNDYTTPEHALAYLASADTIPRRTEGEGVLLSFIPSTSSRILDLGSGDGRLLSLLLLHCENAECIGVDNSPTMIDAANERFRGNPRVQILSHDLERALPDVGSFDAIVSSFAIHHCTNERKRMLYAEILDRLTPDGVFCNLEHVASPTTPLHQRFLDSMGMTTADEDKGNILLDVELNWVGYVKLASMTLTAIGNGLSFAFSEASSIQRAWDNKRMNRSRNNVARSLRSSTFNSRSDYPERYATKVAMEKLS